MLLYTTKFPVRDALSVDQFIQMAIQWVARSKNYHFQNLEYKDNFLSDTDSNSQFQILNFPEEHMTAVHLRHYDGKGHFWASNFFLSGADGTKMIAAQLQCEALEGSVPVGEQFKLPYLLKQIQEQGYAGMDQNLAVQNYPFEVRLENCEQYKALFDGSYAYQMPVVYISMKSDGTQDMDAGYLAALLSGTAHVIVEKDWQAAQMLMRTFSGKKPYNGAVMIFYSAKAYERILPGAQDFSEREVSQKVYQWLLQFETSEYYSWPYWSSKWQQNVLKMRQQESLQQLRKELADIEKKSEEKLQHITELEEYQAIIDSILNENARHTKELEEENFRLKAKIEQYQWERENRMSETAGKPILSMGKEKELYPDEIKDIVLDILAEYLKQVPSGTGYRRKDIVADLLRENSPGGMMAEKSTAVKTTLSGYSGLTAKVRSGLQDIGFSISEGKHYELQFYEDARYAFTMAKTPSDINGIKNLIAEIQKKCF